MNSVPLDPSSSAAASAAGITTTAGCNDEAECVSSSSIEWAAIAFEKTAHSGRAGRLPTTAVKCEPESAPIAANVASTLGMFSTTPPRAAVPRWSRINSRAYASVSASMSSYLSASTQRARSRAITEPPRSCRSAHGFPSARRPCECPRVALQSRQVASTCLRKPSAGLSDTRPWCT